MGTATATGKIARFELHDNRSDLFSYECPRASNGMLRGSDRNRCRTHGTVADCFVIGREISVAEHLRDGQEYEPSLRQLIYFGDIDGRLGKMQILRHRPPYAPFSIMAAAPNMTPVRSKFTSLAMTIEENGVAVARLVPSERSMSASPCSQQSKA